MFAQCFRAVESDDQRPRIARDISPGPSRVPTSTCVAMQWAHDILRVGARVVFAVTLVGFRHTAGSNANDCVGGVDAKPLSLRPQATRADERRR